MLSSFEKFHFFLGFRKFEGFVFAQFGSLSQFERPKLFAGENQKGLKSPALY
jgi:hypothetical protein